MKTVFLAFVISIALHAALATGILLGNAPRRIPEEPAKLDLVHITLSIGDVEKTSEASVSPPTPRPVDTDNLPLPRSEENQPPATTPPPLERFDEPQALQRGIAAVAPAPEAQLPRPSHVDASRQAHVDAPPKPNCSIRPDYPRTARERGEEGDVTLEIRIDADGTVANIRIVKSSGFDALDRAAVKAVRAAHFTPARSEGIPVASTVTLPLAFRLR